MSSCRDEGRDHGEILTGAIEHRDRYDPSVLARYDPAFHVGREPALWGYCADCELAFRWSVSFQQWRPWPGGMALLPHLTDEELDALHMAITAYGRELASVGVMSQNDSTTMQMIHVLGLLSSLDTAVQEARHGLWPVEGPPETTPISELGAGTPELESG